MKGESELGVMAVENEEYYPFGKQVFFFEDMLNSYPNRKFDVFFFSPLDWKKGKKVNGFRYINGEWKKSKEKIPNIIYDRAFSKDEKQKEHIESCRKYLQQSERIILNPFELVSILNNKVEFHKLLIQNGIPTVDVIDFERVKKSEIFNEVKAKRIYIKPIYGSKGEGIFVIESNKGIFTLYDGLGNSKTYKSYQWLLKELLKNMDAPSGYYAQEEAKIIRHEQSPFDIRVLVQNYGNDYRVTGLGARIGVKNSMTSNLNAGGAALPLQDLEDFFKKHFDTDIAKIGL